MDKITSKLQVAVTKNTQTGGTKWKMIDFKEHKGFKTGNNH